MSEKHTEYIQNEFKFLEGLNFDVNIKKSSPMFDGDSFDEEVYFSSKLIQIKLWFGKFVNGPLLTISISKVGENKCFSFEEYLLFKNITNFKSFEYEDAEKYIARIAQIFNKELSGDLGDIISGKKWIDIPKDYNRIR